MKMKEIIILTASYYGRNLTPQVLQMYVEDFDGFDELAVVDAYRAYRKNPKNKSFPLPAQIIEILDPVISIDTQAQEITSRIIQSISKFGYVGFKDAQAFVGEIGWGVVRRLGGWEYVCREHGVSLNPGQFYAQTRDLVKAQIEIQNSPAIDMARLLNGPERSVQALPAPVEFTEQESEKLYEQFKNKPTEMLEQYVHALAKQKSMKGEGA